MARREAPSEFELLDHIVHRIAEEDYEKDAREREEKVGLIYASCTEVQKGYLDDQHDQISVLAPRRTGKTHVFGADMHITCLSDPEANVAYITRTIKQAKRNIWDILLDMMKRYDIPGKPLKNELVIEFPWGAKMFLGGAETEDDRERYRGLKLTKAILDECSLFPPDTLQHFLDVIIGPTLYDTIDSKLVIGGTPGPILAGEFYDSTNNDCDAIEVIPAGKFAIARKYAEREAEKYKDVTFEWSFHKWKMSDNTAKPHAWLKALEKHKRRREPDDNPKWMREALGEWVSDDTGFVYTMDKRLNTWAPISSEGHAHGLPGQHEWRFVCGIDPGHDDAFAIEVFAFAETCDRFYHVHEFVKSGMIIDEMATEIQKAMDVFGGFYAMVIDQAGSGKALCETLRKSPRYGFPLIPAPKTDKRDYIELVNSEMQCRRMHVIDGSVLAGQYETLQWEDPRTKRREHPKMPNDACDAALYTIRYALEHIIRPLDKELTWEEKFERQEEEDVRRMELAESTVDSWRKALRVKEDRFRDMKLSRQLSPHLKGDWP